MNRPPSPRVGLLAVLFAAVAAITCSDSSTGPSKGLRGVLGLAPVFSKSAEDVYRNLASFQLEVNNVRVVLLRANGVVALDTTVTVVAGQDSVVLELTVPIQSGLEETFEAAIELRDGTEVLFSGTQTVIARIGAGGSPPSTPIELEFIGPGATVTTLDILPDTTIVTPDSLVMRAVAFDQNNQPVPELNIEWSVNDPTRATINDAGVLKPIGPRGSVVVTARLMTDTAATATVNILSRPTTVVVLGGANQTATVATNLPNAIEVEVRAADNLPVSGHPITFSYSGTNGTLLQSGAVTDANGRATASVNVGTLAGAHTVTITAAGIAPITTNVTVTPGAAATIVATAGAALTDTAGANVATAQLPTVTVRDAFSNVIPNAQVKFRRHGGANATINTQPDTMVLVNTDGNGVAALTGRRLQTNASPPQDTVLATLAGLNDTLRFAATVTHASPSRLVFTQQPSNATSGDVISPTVTVRVRDQFDNPVTTGAGATASITLSLSGGTSGATLGPTPASVTQNAFNGTATFTLSVDRSGTAYQLTAAASGLTGATSSAFDIAAGAATAVVAQTNLTVTDTAGASLPTANIPSVLVRDANNNGIPNVPVTFRRRSLAGGTINAQPDTMVLVNTNASGIASLTGRRLQTVTGLDTVLATAAGLNDTLRFAATVTHANATQLVYGTQPVGGTAGSSMPDFTVEVRDQFGNRVTTGTNATKAIALSMTGATLSGTTTVNAISGVATFTGLSVSPAGSPYQITAAASPLVSATSANFAMTSPAPVTRTWASAVTGSWETAGNWSGGVVPGPQDTVVINISGTFAVSISSAVTIGKLIVGGGTGVNSLSVTGIGASLTVSDSVRIAASGAMILGTTGGGTLLTSGPVVVDGTLQWFQGTVAGSGSIRINATGAMVLGGSGATTLNGRPIDNGGTLVFSGADPNTLTLANGASIENSNTFLIQGSADIAQGSGAAGSFLNVGTVAKTFGDANTTTIGVAFTNSGTATLEIQTGTLAFTGPGLTNASTATIRGVGTLDVSGTSFTNAGTLSPGFSPGTLTIAGALPLQASSKVAIDIGGTTPGTEHDVVTVSGAATLAGTLEVTLQSFTPELGQTFTIMNFASRSGTMFATITGASLGGGLRLEAQYGTTQLTLVVVSDVPTATINWVSGTNGNWNTPGNWDLNRVPNASDIVGIAAAGSYTVTLETFVTVAGLVVGDDDASASVYAPVALTVNGPTFVSPNGLLILPDGVLGGTGTVTNLGQLLLLSNATVAATTTIVNEGLLDLEGNAVINGPLQTAELSEISVLGNATYGAANVQIASGFTNNGRILIVGTSGFASTLTVGGTLTNAITGLIQSANSGGARTLIAQLDNQGEIRSSVALDINKPGADHVNSGLVSVLQDLTITQTGTTPSFTNTSTGQLSIGANRELEFLGGAVDIDEGVISGGSNARVQVDAATLALAPGNIIDVAFQLTGGTTIAGGALNIGDSEILLLANGSTIGDAVNLTATTSFGTLRVLGTASITGPLTIAPAGVLDVTAGSESSTTLTIANGFTNNGTINLNGFSGLDANLIVSGNGQLRNANGGVIRTLNTGSRTITASLTNEAGGTVDVDANLTLTGSGAEHVNAGTIDVSLANLLIQLSGTTPSFTNTSTGVITLAANRTMTVDGGALTLDSGSDISGTGTSRLITTGTVALSFAPSNLSTVPLQLSATTTIAGGTVTIASGETLNLMGNGATSTLTAAVAIQAGGELLTNGSVSLTGALSIASNGIFRVQGQTTGGAATTTVASGFTNAGIIELASNNAQAATLNVTSGALQNNAGGVIRTLNTGTKTLGAQLLNQDNASIEVGANNSLTINKAGAAHTNDGTIDATNGDVVVTMSGTSPSFTNSTNGLISLGATTGRTVTFSVSAGTTGAALNLLAGSVTGGANSWLVTNTTAGAPLTLALATPVVNEMPLRLLGPNATLASPLTIASGQTLVLSSQPGTSTLNGNLTVQIGGLLLLKGNTQLNGALTVNSGATVRVEGETWAGPAVATVANGFTNSGTIELTSTANAAATLDVTTGTLINANLASIGALAGGGGARTIAAQIQNNVGGLVYVGSALTIDKDAVTQSNNGTINVADANLTISLGGESPRFENDGAITLGANRDLIVTAESGANGALLMLQGGSVTGDGSTRLVTTGPGTLIYPISVANMSVPLQLAATTTYAGTLALGSPYTLTLTGRGGSSTLNLDLSIQNGGTLVANGTVALNGAVSISTNGILRAQGLTFNGSPLPAVVTVANGFTNNGNIELTSTGGNAATLAVASGTLVNASGAFIKSLTTGARTLAAQIDNSGEITVSNALTIDKDGADHSNGGVLRAETADLTINLNGTGSSFSNASGGTIQLGAGAETPRTLTVNSASGSSGAILDIDEGLISGDGFDRIVTTGAGVLGMFLSPANVGTLPLQLGANTVVSGPVTIGSGQFLTLMGNGSSSNLSAALDIQGGGTFIGIGTVNLQGAVTVQSTGVLRASSQSLVGTTTLTVSNGFTNNGFIELTGTGGQASVLNVTTGTLTNASGAVIKSLSSGTRILGAQLLNLGTVDVENGLTLDKESANHVNSGTIDLNDGQLIVQQSGSVPSFQQTSSGSVTLGSGRTFMVINGLLDVDEGTISGPTDATLWLSGPTIAFTPATVTVPMRFLDNAAISGGSVTIANGQTLILYGAGGTSTINDNVVIQNGGLLQTVGLTALNGSLDIQAGGILQNYGSPIGPANLTILNGFANNGTIQLDAENSEASVLTVTNNTLTNTSLAGIQINGSGTRTLTAQIANAGSIDVNTALTINKASAAHTNSGDIDLNANLTIAQSAGGTFTNSGDLAIDGFTLTVSGGSFTNNLADNVALRGPGTLDVSATTFVNNGTLQPTGILNVTGNYAQGSGGELFIAMGNTGCTTFDRLLVSGTASLAGTLTVFVNDCLPVNANTFDVMTFSSKTGTFAYPIPAPYSGGTMQLSYPITGTSARLTATAN